MSAPLSSPCLTLSREERLARLAKVRAELEALIAENRDVLASFTAAPGGAPMAFGKETTGIASKAAAAWSELPAPTQALFAPATGPALALDSSEVDALNSLDVLGALFSGLTAAALGNAQSQLAYHTNLFVDKARAFSAGLVPGTDAALVQVRCAGVFSLIDERNSTIQRRKSKNGALRDALTEEQSARESLEEENQALRGEAPAALSLPRPTPPAAPRRPRARRRS